MSTSITLTSNSLISNAKSRGQIPNNQITFDTDDFLQIANDELVIGIIPTVLQLHEDYYLVQEDIPMVNATSNYAIPYRAMGNKLRDVKYKDTSGSLFEMTRIMEENRTDYGNTTIQTTSGLRFYYLQNNEIILWPNLSGTATGSLVVNYYLRPNALVKENRAGLITDINRTTGTITIDDFPDNFTSTIQYDFVMARSPHKIITFDISATGVSSGLSTVTFDLDDIPTSLVVGDYVMQAGETIIPQLPTELHMILAQRITCRCLDALGDSQGLSNANTKLQEMEYKTGILIDNRVEGSPQKVVNRTGFIRRSRTWRR